MISLVLLTLSLVICGFVLGAIAPSVSSEELEAVKVQFFEGYRHLVQPEPQEHFIYFGLLVTFPLFLSAAIATERWLIARRIFIKSSTGPVVFALILIATMIIFMTDENLRLIPIWALVLAAGIGVLAAISEYALACFHQRLTFKFAFLLVTTFGAMTAFGWRTFGSSAPIASGINLQAFAYSIVLVANGHTCLVDFAPQYGCYSELLAPIFKIIGLSILKLTITLNFLTLVSLISIFCFLHTLIRSPIIFLSACVCILFSLFQVWYTADPYFQYVPLRLFFPAVSLLGVLWFQGRPQWRRAAVLGGFAAIAIIWNLDSGAVVGLALAILVAFTGSTSLHFRIYDRAVPVSAYIAALAGVLMLAYQLIALKAGVWPDPAAYTIYQHRFFNVGFMMNPLPMPLHSWMVAVAIAVVTLIIAARRYCKGPLSFLDERAAYLSILYIGLFSYYLGRSHNAVFLVSSWPWIGLAFFLLDRYSLIPSTRARHINAIAAMAGASVLVLFIGCWPRIFLAASDTWASVISPSVGAIEQQVDFIRRSAPPDEAIGLLSMNPVPLLIEVQQPFVIFSTAPWDILTPDDERRLIGEIRSIRPRDLFIGLDVLDGIPGISDELKTLVDIYDIDGSNFVMGLRHFKRY